MSHSKSEMLLRVGEAELRLEELFRREYEPMHRLAFTLLRSDSDAEEVVQDAFLAVAPRLHSIANAGGYLRTTVVNGARRRLRRRAIWQPPAVPLEQQAEVRNGIAPIGPEYLVDLVDQLPERERVAVVMRYYGGWNATEIGEALQCPAGTVRSMLHRSIVELRGMLSHD